MRWDSASVSECGGRERSGRVKEAPGMFPRADSRAGIAFSASSMVEP